MDLATVLQGNWFNSFKGALKYITLERLAPDFCVAVVDPIFNASHPNAAVNLMCLLSSHTLCSFGLAQRIA
ncbi:hypothetical protein BDM02DRAFT_3119609 [Thelephora ganbajun]|uniref:Uncharacterized protein n=1 Tax=Thelephora ganbajun TaxID=370292 RepID=A0ACB6Z7Z7_THEGA|nr:hypothetical protein BDM02DRAFT_3119609 [Thelephora ganbajun]